MSPQKANGAQKGPVKNWRSGKFFLPLKPKISSLELTKKSSNWQLKLQKKLVL